MTKPSEPTQPAKFETAARDLECDDDPECFREGVAKLVRKPEPEKPE